MTSIIIPFKDNWELTQKCLASIEKFTPEEHEVILIDNGSIQDDAEGAVQWRNLHKSWHEYSPNVDRTIIHNGLNRGYPAAINQGLAVAKGDTICLLNNDTEVTAGWLDPMLMVLRGGYGMVGPCSDNVSGEQGSGGFGVMGVGDPNAIVYYDASRLVGFCLLMKRAVLDKIGGLDERFGIGNFDDDDYCIRAQLAGFYLAIVRNSFVHHVGGATFRAEGIDYQKLLVENWVKFQDKWGVPAHVPMGAPYILMADPDTNLYIPLPVLA